MVQDLDPCWGLTHAEWSNMWIYGGPTVLYGPGDASWLPAGQLTASTLTESPVRVPPREEVPAGTKVFSPVTRKRLEFRNTLPAQVIVGRLY